AIRCTARARDHSRHREFVSFLTNGFDFDIAEDSMKATALASQALTGDDCAASAWLEPPSGLGRFGRMLGRSAAMRNLFALLARVAPTGVAILIEGETGTGKELCAEAIHRASARAQAPFVVCDLAGMSRSLIESELFGHARGAFTGAVTDHAGA